MRNVTGEDEWESDGEGLVGKVRGKGYWGGSEERVSGKDQRNGLVGRVGRKG